MMNREGLLSSLKGLSKNVYSREELLPEMDLLEEEMAQIVFEDGLFTRSRTAIHSLFNMPTTQHVSY